MSTEKTPPFMPILDSVKRALRSSGVNNFPERLPWPLFATEAARRQCEVNHSQSPETLARRGGLGINEALAILKGERTNVSLSDADALPLLKDLLDHIHTMSVEPLAHGKHVIDSLRRTEWGAALSREAVIDLLMYHDAKMGNLRCEEGSADEHQANRSWCMKHSERGCESCGAVSDNARRMFLLGNALRLVLVHIGVIASEAAPTGPELLAAAEEEVMSKAPTPQELHDLLVEAQSALAAVVEVEDDKTERPIVRGARAVLAKIKEAIG